MTLRLAIVGPGRVGRALGRRWAESGIDLLGFVGRSAAGVAEALAFCGAGRALGLRDLLGAQVVVFAVGDGDLTAAVAAAAAAVPVRRASLWLHTSGRHGLEVLAPLASDPVRLGALHPAVPFADAASGLQRLRGGPAVLLGDARALSLLRALARRLSMQPLISRGGDRTLYHTACALAANGLTALRAVVDEVFAAAAVLSPADAAILAQALMAAALQACGEHGPTQALSGPVLRGDTATVTAHRRALRQTAPLHDAVYRALMTAALELARARGLSAAAAAAVGKALVAAD